MRILEAIASGVVATAFLDIWQRILRLLSGLPPSNWALVGRWFIGAARGRLFHDSIAAEPPAANELAIGWIGHYATGVLYGFAYLAFLRSGLGIEPSLLNGLVFGACSVVVPWFFFMPAMGAGVLASKAPRPIVPCLQALASHTAFGLGLAAGSFLV
ncbi:MAG: DUF2938 family protein [Alphaproteobacteria bacterium]|nr:DUF2938 family protein [Alphaproteobacteria bacterium]